VETDLLNSRDGLRNLMRHAHGRRMLAGFIVAREKPATDGFINAVALIGRQESAEMKSLLRAHTWSPEDVRCAIQHQFIDTIEPGDVAYERMVDIATKQIPLPTNVGLHATILASPLLSPAAAEKIYLSPKTTNIFKEILGANPNLPDRYRPSPTKQPPSPAFLMAVSTFGNLQSPQIQTIIREHLLYKTATAKNRFGCYEKLAVRRDVPMGLLTEMDERFDGYYYWLLTQNPLHKEIRENRNNPTNSVPGEWFEKQRGKRKKGILVHFGESGIRLDPEVKADGLANLFSKTKDLGQSGKLASWPEDLAIISAHPNASKTLMEWAIKTLGPSLTTGRIHKILSSGIRDDNLRIMLAKTREADYARVYEDKNCPAEVLLWACENALAQNEGSIISLVTHPNFPWEKCSKEYVKENTSRAVDGLVAAAKCLAKKATQSEIQEWAAGDLWQSVLFAENLSAVQLSKMASAHPESAAIIATHPNADSIPAPESRRQAVSKFRQSLPGPVLVGRKGNEGCGGTGAHLAI